MACPCAKKPNEYYLLDFENVAAPVRSNGKRGWYHPPPRKKKIRGIVVHTAEALDIRAPSGRYDDFSFASYLDLTAESVAKYLSRTDREASAHVVTDVDSVVQLLPDDYTAFHVRGHNSETLGLEIGYRAADWGKRKQHEKRILLVAACAAREWARKYDIPIVRLTADEWNSGARGFIAHADLDPSRRTDPGENFPWARFLAFVKNAGQTGGDAVYAPKRLIDVWREAHRMSMPGFWLPVQAALQARGFYRGRLDGVRGPLTQRGICEFQHRNFLTVDGVCGPKTLAALGLADAVLSS